MALFNCPPCMNCGKTSTVVVASSGLEAWRNGAYIQDAFPLLSAGDREMLLTGIHPACWYEMFPSEEDE